MICDIGKNKRQGHETLPFLEIYMRHWGPPIKVPTIAVTMCTPHMCQGKVREKSQLYVRIMRVSKFPLICGSCGSFHGKKRTAMLVPLHHCSLREQKLSFLCQSFNIGPIYKQLISEEKFTFGPKLPVMAFIPDHTEDLGTPFSPIDSNTGPAFPDFRSI